MAIEKCQFLTFEVNFLCQESSKSFLIFFHWKIYLTNFCYWLLDNFNFRDTLLLLLHLYTATSTQIEHSSAVYNHYNISLLVFCRGDSLLFVPHHGHIHSAESGHDVAAHTRREDGLCKHSGQSSPATAINDSLWIEFQVQDLNPRPHVPVDSQSSALTIRLYWTFKNSIYILWI